MMDRKIILDTETTGLLTTSKHRLVEIGCLEMVNRRFTQKHFHCYLNPQRPVDKGALAVHGLTDEFLKDKPLFSQIVEEFLDFVNGAELIIHNAPFDIGFLNYELNLLNQAMTPIERHCTVTDTLVLARQKHPGQPNNLDALCRRYQIDNSNRDLHGALIDAQLLGRVYLAMTGGQDQLFASEAAALPVAEAVTISKASKIQRQPLPIIQPSSEEWTNHQEFLALLRTNGHCIWDLRRDQT